MGPGDGREEDAQREGEGWTSPAEAPELRPWEQQGPHEEVPKSLGLDFGDKPGAAQARLAEVGDTPRRV